MNDWKATRRRWANSSSSGFRPTTRAKAGKLTSGTGSRSFVILRGDDQPPVAAQRAEDARAEVATAEERARDPVELRQVLHHLGREELVAHLPDRRQVAPERQAGDRPRRQEHAGRGGTLGGERRHLRLGVSAGRRREGEVGREPIVVPGQGRRGPRGLPRGLDPGPEEELEGRGNRLPVARRTSSGRSRGGGRAWRTPRPSRPPRPPCAAPSRAARPRSRAPRRAPVDRGLQRLSRVGEQEPAVDDRVRLALGAGEEDGDVPMLDLPDGVGPTVGVGVLPGEVEQGRMEPGQGGRLAGRRDRSARSAFSPPMASRRPPPVVSLAACCQGIPSFAEIRSTAPRNLR